MKWKFSSRDQMSYWQLIFSQSKVNGASYKNDELPTCNWNWPTDTYLQRRRSLVLKHSAAVLKVLPPRCDHLNENRSVRMPSMSLSKFRVGRAPLESSPAHGPTVLMLAMRCIVLALAQPRRPSGLYSGRREEEVH